MHVFYAVTIYSDICFIHGTIGYLSHENSVWDAREIKFIVEVASSTYITYQICSYMFLCSDNEIFLCSDNQILLCSDNQIFLCSDNQIVSLLLVGTFLMIFEEGECAELLGTSRA